MGIIVVPLIAHTLAGLRGLVVVCLGRVFLVSYNQQNNLASDQDMGGTVTGVFLSNENTIGPAIDLLALVLREASKDR